MLPTTDARTTTVLPGAQQGKNNCVGEKTMYQEQMETLLSKKNEQVKVLSEQVKQASELKPLQESCG